MEYMEQQMQNYIEAGLSEADKCYARIAELEGLNQVLAATVEALRDALVELRDVAQRCDSWESFPQNALDAADAALHETSHCAEIKIPTGAERWSDEEDYS